MVIVKLIGGLGNQLFQYAAGRQLASFHKTTLKLDINSFEQYKLHRYSLAPFRISEIFATPEDVAIFMGGSKKRLSRFIFKALQKLKPYYCRPVIRELHFKPYNPNLARSSENVYLDGYWQSEKYFADSKEIIRHEFTIKVEQDDLSHQIAKQIAETQSVSIHVRRGDYVSNSLTNQVHGTPGPDYYRQCISLIAEKVANPHFFVFSDDPAWVVKNLQPDYPTTYVTHNDASKNYEDLRLMSLCQHNIIANSTFSWWAAWLNSNPAKIVLAPQRWFNRPDIDTRDLLPENWIKV